MKNSFIPFLAFTFLGVAYAGDYVRDPNPRWYVGRVDDIGVAYKTADDPQVCPLYLKNLRYFATRNLPMACNQPIAPGLEEKIKAVEWEDLDPDKYPELFSVLAAAKLHGRHDAEAVSDKELASSINEVKTKEYVFRRAKLELKGQASFPSEYVNIPDRKFQIVQYDLNISDKNHEMHSYGCGAKQGRVLKYSDSSIGLFIVTQDLQRVYSQLFDLIDGLSAINLLTISNIPYGEWYDDKGEVRISEIHTKRDVFLESVCLFHFNSSSKKGK